MRDRLTRLFVRYRARRDGRALARVFDRTAPQLLAVAVHLIDDPRAAEDLVQETFRVAIERADSFDADGDIKAWLYGILAREAARARRRNARSLDPERLAVPTAEDPADRAMAAEVQGTLLKALERCRPVERDVLKPFLIEGRTSSEIARDLGRAPGTVRTQIHRGLERLRRALPAGMAVGALAQLLSSHGLAATRTRVLETAGVSSEIHVPVSSGVMGGIMVSKKLLAIPIVAVLAVVATVLVAREARSPGGHPPPTAPVLLASTTTENASDNEIQATGDSARHAVPSEIDLRGTVHDCFGGDGSSYVVVFDTSPPSIASCSPDGTFELRVTPSTEVHSIQVRDDHSRLLLEKKIELRSDAAPRSVDLDLEPPIKMGVRLVSPSGSPVRPVGRTTAIPVEFSSPRIIVHRDLLRDYSGQFKRTTDRGSTRTRFGSFLADPSEVGSSWSESGCLGVAVLDECAPVHVIALMGSEPIGWVHVSAYENTVEITVDPSALDSLCGALSGRILNIPNPKPEWGGVTVKLDPLMRKDVLFPVQSDGSFSFDRLDPGIAWLIVDYPGRVRRTEKVEIPAGDILDVGEIHLEAGVMLEGHVRTLDGASAGPDLWVATVDGSGRDRGIGGFPDCYPSPENGYFYVLNLPSTFVLLGVDDPRFAVNPSIVDLSSGTVKDYVLLAVEGTSVWLISSDPQTVDHIEVLDSNSWLVYSTSFPESTRCSVRLIPGSYTLVLTSIGGSATTKRITVGNEDLTVHL